MQPDVSVIVCTHNPRRHYLTEVFNALKLQSIPIEKWELIIVDNASSAPVKSAFNFDWHPNISCLEEQKLGLTTARLCGIQRASAELLIFVDDDNVLNPTYLETALRINKEYTSLGAWGGQTLPSFEEEPPEWTESYWTRVGVRQFQNNRYSHSMEWEATPIGAGMCVRKIVARKYADLVSQDFRRSQLLGRKGDMLLGCEDLDLAWTSIDLGYEIGLFADLKLLHLIPKHRLDKDYLLKAVQGSDYSEVILKFLRDGKLTWKQKLRFWMPWLMPSKLWFASSREKEFYKAGATGRHLAVKDILQKQIFSELENIKV